MDSGHRLGIGRPREEHLVPTLRPLEVADGYPGQDIRDLHGRLRSALVDESARDLRTGQRRLLSGAGGQVPAGR